MTFDQAKDLLLILLPPVSVLSGVALTEYMTSRRNKNQFLAGEVMGQKLELYQELYERLIGLRDEGDLLLDSISSAITKTAIAKLAESFVRESMRLATFTTEKRLFLDRRVTDQVTYTGLTLASVMSLEPKSKDYRKEIAELRSDFHEECERSVEMIESYSGIKRIRKSLHTIYKPKGASESADLMENLRKDYNAGKRKKRRIRIVKKKVA